MPRKPPAQRPHGSEQTVFTPPVLLAAVQARFGPIGLDAASCAPHVCEWWLGPGSILASDGLGVPWIPERLTWINPPFNACGRWAEKCKHEAERGVRSLLLTPLSPETRWYEQHVEGHALVLALRPRVRFVGHTADFPKGLMLSCFGFGETPRIETWRWRAWTPRKKRLPSIQAPPGFDSWTDPGNL